MKAVICRSFAPVEELDIGEFAAPEPGAGDVLIEVSAAGVNFPDGLMVQGKYQTKPDLPFVPGSELAGIVKAVGADVRGITPGTRVAAFSGIGGFAELAAVPAAQVFALPEKADVVTASGILITYGTSYHALKDRAGLQAGETLLVLGAAGGVGLAAVELGALMGARVIAAASTPEKLALAREYGAAETIDYANEDLRGRIKELTGGKGVDVVYDPVGGDMTVPAIKALAWGGRHLVIGFAAGDIPQIPANMLLLKSAAAVGVLWGNSLRADPVHHAGNIAQLMEWLAEGKICPAIDAVFPFDQAIEAINHVMERRARGKVILSVKAEGENK
ncbi:NADPH:quinone oxidoreductase [Croceicoccus estronivorus]|uniref:NADPH:quinone oxidoreductase family protein n=1 Tax=Croceicoccus estronivorus TaxID=1172626 RepID=UPI0008351FCD|nr:NADPH:quinone oxidoreductase family protein [Croceicoccus estronivorus]OCC25482.1 NADPH:quinone oxidoreductase [Croceicoccus estronivorus]